MSIGLQADRGTNLPLALKECIKLASENRAHKKVIIMLTDGDVNGSFDPKELVEYGTRQRIDMVCIGVKGSDKVVLERVFGRNAIYVKKIERLAEELRRVVVRRV